MVVERIEPGTPVTAPTQNFGQPPDQYFQPEATPAAPVVTEPVIAPTAVIPDVAAPVVTEPAATGAPADQESWLNSLPEDAAKEIKRLRNESQGYRQRAQTAESVFEGWHPDDKAYVENLLRDSVANPAAAAANWQHAAEVFGAYGEQIPDGVVGDPGAAPAPAAGLTMADLNRALDERERRTQQVQQRESQQRSIVEKAVQLGYSENTADYVALLHYAVKETNGDLDAAHAKVQAQKQAVIDGYLAQQAAAAGGVPTPVPSGAGPMPSGQPIKNFKDSRAGLEAFLDSTMGARN